MDISRQNLQVVLRQLCEWGNDLHSIDWDSSCLARDPPTPPTQFEFGLLAHLPISPFVVQDGILCSSQNLFSFSYHKTKKCSINYYIPFPLRARLTDVSFVKKNSMTADVVDVEEEDQKDATHSVRATATANHHKLKRTERVSTRKRTNKRTNWFLILAGPWRVYQRTPSLMNDLDREDKVKHRRCSLRLVGENQEKEQIFFS